MFARFLTSAAALSMLLVFSACIPPERGENEGLMAFEDHPLMAETIADKMIGYVTDLQIRANERKQPITDPATLRVMDSTFVEARRLRDRAHREQDEGKDGAFTGNDGDVAKGDVLLFGKSLFFGYTFEVDAAPGMRVFLAQNVAPSTEQEFRSEPVLDLGPLKNLIGPQEYAVKKLTDDEWNAYRTVVLFSEPLKRIVGTAQIHGRPR